MRFRIKKKIDIDLLDKSIIHKERLEEILKKELIKESADLLINQIDIKRKKINVYLIEDPIDIIICIEYDSFIDILELLMTIVEIGDKEEQIQCDSMCLN